MDLHNRQEWHGVWTALITPLKSENKGVRLDVASLEKLIESQIQDGIKGLVIAGSTGEGSLLPENILHDLWKNSLQIVAGRIPLVGGLGIGGTWACLKNLEKLAELGFQGALASPPAYIKAPQRGLKEHYLELGRMGLPICIYEIAGRSAVSIAVDTLVELKNSSDPGARSLVAIKDASGDMSRIKEEKKKLGDHFALLSGDDGTVADFIYFGGHGVVSVASHVLPREMNDLVRWPQEARYKEAKALQMALTEKINVLFSESNPIPVKSLLAHRGVISEASFCPPLCASLNPEKIEAVYQKKLVLKKEVAAKKTSPSKKKSKAQKKNAKKKTPAKKAKKK